MAEKSHLYGEVISYAPEVRKATLLSVVQALTLGFTVVTMVFFILQVTFVGGTTDPDVDGDPAPWFNVYVYTVVYGVVGAVLILLLQPIGLIGYMWRNRVKRGAMKGGRVDDHSYMGVQHTRELILGVLSSILGFAIIMWLLISWLNRFDKTCCDSASSDPNTVVGGDALSADALTKALFMQWRVYYAAFGLSTLISFVMIVFLFRAVFSHFMPLRAITQIYTQ